VTGALARPARRAALFAGLFLLTMPAASPAKLAYRDGAGRVIVARDDGSAPRVVARHGLQPSLAPNGRRLAYFTRASCKCTARVLHVSGSGGRHRHTLARNVYRPGFRRLPLPWAPDSRFLAVSAWYRFGGYLVDSAKRKRSFVASDFRFDGATFSPTAKRMIYEDSGGRCSDGRIVLLTIASGRRTSLGCGEAVVWGPKGFAYLKGAGVYFARRPGEKPRRLIDEGGAIVAPVAWSADGRRLLLYEAGASETALRALILDRGTGRVKRLDPVFSNIAAISRDGHAVLGVRAGDVVAVRDDGTTTVLAKNASTPSWTR
jgi:hypothetical protein